MNDGTELLLAYHMGWISDNDIAGFGAMVIIFTILVIMVIAGIKIYKWWKSE